MTGRKLLGRRAPPSGGAGRGAYGNLDWWIGLLFAIGSACFALGAFPALAARADPTAVGVTFFVGSLFFTSAAALQLVEAIRERGGTALLDRVASAVQFVGTLFFNWTTFAGLNDALDTQERIARVWAPDALGSICFLVASYVGSSDQSGERQVASSG